MILLNVQYREMLLRKNTNGHAIVSQQYSVDTGSNNIQLNNLASQLPGNYFIDVLINGKVTATQKVVKH